MTEEGNTGKTRGGQVNIDEEKKGKEWGGREGDREERKMNTEDIKRRWGSIY